MNRILPVFVALLCIVAVIPGVVAASEFRAGGAIVVAEDETVGDLTVMGGTVQIDGTVDGDLTVMGGNVILHGSVTGDVEVITGNLRMDGPVGGSVSVIAGNVVVGESGAVAGTVSAIAGTVSVAGAIDGDLRAVSGTVRLTDTAAVAGDVRYSGDFARDPGSTVGGQIEREPRVTTPQIVDVTVPGPFVVGLYFFVVNFIVGAILLLAAPGASRTVADTARSAPIRSLVIGLFVVLGIPLALVLVALTIVGIPLSLVGFLVFALLVWIALILGRYAIGVWILALVGREHRWLALAIGLAVVGALAALPVAGTAISAAVTLIGLGAMAIVTVDRR